MESLTAFQEDLLNVIAGEGEVSGQDVKYRVEQMSVYSIGGVNHGRLYPNLDTLVEKGLVEKGELDRRTNSYTITDDGRAWLSSRRAERDQAAGNV